MCVLFPLVKGEVSKLYQELYKFTNQDRRLTNFLYALSLQESVKNQFTKKEKNSQGEIRSDDFIRKFDLKRFVSDASEIEAEKKAIGAINDAGEEIKYDAPDEILDKVLDYNDTHSRHRATIAFSDGKFVIKLDRVNAGNFRNNEVLRNRLAQFQGINKYLKEIGFSVDYSQDTISSLANFNNVRYFENTLVDMKRSLENLSVPRASLLRDLMKGKSHLLERIIDNFKDDTAELISIVSQEKTDDRLDAYWTAFINRFLEEAGIALKSMNFNDMDASKKEFTDALEPSTAEWFGVESDLLNDTLKELYEKYHLNQDLLSESRGALNSLSAIADRLFGLGLTRLDIARHREGTTSDQEKFMRYNKKDIDNGRYAESIISFLSDLLGDFEQADETFSTLTKDIQDTSRETDEDLEKINRISKFIYDNLKLVDAYAPVIDALVNPDRISLDQPDLPAEFIHAISSTAKNINDLMANIRHKAREAQFESVVALLSIGSWGNSDVRITSSGRELSLRSIVQNLAVDPNLLDRFLYSINECNDTGLALIHNTIKSRYRERDSKLRTISYIVRSITDELGKDSKFMFVRDGNGNPTGMLKSYIDFGAYDKAKADFIKSLKDAGIKGREFSKKIRQWVDQNREYEHVPFDGQNETYNNAFTEYCQMIYGKAPVIVDEEGVEHPAQFTTDIPRVDLYFSKDLDSMTDAEYKYYSKMLALKAALGLYVPENLEFFDAVQISGNILNALGETGGDPVKMLNMVKNRFADAFQRREDDTEFGETFGDVLEANGMKTAVSDLNGHELMSMPLYFTHKLKDTSRLSTDFSQAILAYAQSTMQYYEMNKIADSLMLTEDYFRTQRDVQEAAGGNGIVNVVRMAQDTFARSLSKKSGDTNIGGILTDLYEREVYGRKKKDEGTVSLFGVDVSTAKAVDWLTGYTSRTGLVVNMLGAQANALVGKIQMHIEAVAGEFFDIKDLAAGEVAYFRYLPAYLNEYLSNNKKSFLGLLGDRFNIMEDFYQELRDKGFHTSAIGKILGNTNLFMLYGMGEHLLHFEPALAVLHAHKVYDTKTKNEVTLLQALEESYKEMDNATPDAKNLMFYLNRQRYQWLEGEEKRSITDNDILQVEKRITYVNKSMHGAFNDLEKGMASRYAAGRLVMNFRQWMPAHYERRFRGLHYDADLGDDREGYYVSSVKFLWGCIKDLGDRRMQIATRWNELSDMEKYNLKRCIAEIQTLALLSVANLSLGEYKDKKGNWAYRNLMYQVKRMLMETRASTPIPDLIPMLFGKQAQPLAFVDNIMQLLVSPFAAVNTIKDIVSIMDFSKLLITIEGGKYDGENKYFHDLKKVLPYYGSIRKQIGLADEDYIFKIFE